MARNAIKETVHQWIWLLLLAFCLIGLVYPLIGALALICMLAPVIVAFWRGRMWCGNFCPRGSFNDIVLAKFSARGKTPAFLRANWFRIVFLAGLMSTFAFQLTLAWGDPVAIGRVFVRMIIVTTLLTVILGLIYQPRTWCAFCPMGTMAYFVAGLKELQPRLRPIRFNREACINCNLCTKNCPVNIDVLSFKQAGVVADPNCLKCGVCVAKCPKKALS